MSTLLEEPAALDDAEAFRVGSLSYTRAGLVVLFMWLLWGDFVFILMETVVPSIVPLKLHHLGAKDWILGLIVVTVPRAMDFVVNPIVSYMSDRTRTRWGRRRPYLLVATPLVTIALVMMGYSPEITAAVGKLIGSPAHQTAIAIGVIAVLMILFQIANMFINSIYYYYFNDVVPHGFLSRFMALFRIVGTLAAAAYGYFIYGKAETHSREIFLWTALAYCLVFTFMCIAVKEGSYPPPSKTVDGRRTIWSGVKTFVEECFSLRIYWYFFLANTCWALAMGCMGAFSPFYAASNGVSLSQLGTMGAVTNILTAAALYPSGVLADRYHPLNVNLWGAFIMVCVIPLQFIFMYRGLSLSAAPICFYVICGAGSVLQAVYAASEFPMYMKILPLDRYGQFCSANSMLRAVAMIVGGPAAGLFLDFMRRFDVHPYDHYRYIPVWTLTFMIGCMSFLFLLRREWYRRGGTKGYTPPPPLAGTAAGAAA